ncbi:MAG: chemotaxis protein CheB [Pseudomonadota bacterium]
MGQVDESFYLIGVGASAGGLDAIKQLLSRVEPDFPHSLVIVQHISPDYKSLMSEILARETTLPVHEVTDNMAVEAGNIYLIPPRANILIQGTKGDTAAHTPDNGGAHTGLRFSLVEPKPRPGLNLPIDVFFQSLAEAVGDRAIAVILSGSGSDGSRGLRAIKDREGFVLVQDPKMAAFDGMPRSAIASGIVDMVLAPDLMVGEINRYLEMRSGGIENVDTIFDSVDDTLAELLRRVSRVAELDFTLYKEPTLKRRIARRMALKGYFDLNDYLAHLDEDPSELNTLYREFLVGVTNFFRDLPVWRHLRDTVIPELFREGGEEPLRIWSVGCSTGEEPYTIAMILQKYRTDNNISRDFRIFATDVNERAIQTAKQAIYPDTIREEIPDEFLNEGFLTFQAGTFSVAPTIRNKVVLSVHNAIEHPPFTRTDLIVCRNLLIYLSPDVQAKVMTHFSFSLRRGGVLQLGAAETTGPHGDMFEAILHKSRVYRNTRQATSVSGRAVRTLDFPVTALVRRPTGQGSSSDAEGDIATLLKLTLEEQHGFICITDELGKLTRTFGNHAGIFDIPDTGFSATLLDLVDDRLRSAVALVLRKADMEGHAEKKGVRLSIDPDSDLVDISCRKVPWQAKAWSYVVTFRHRKAEAPVTGSRIEVSADDAPSAARIQQLEAEIQSLQDILGATAEDLSTSNEQLQTTNEELIASNEELQANNEETQSINEELYALNAENSEKIAELEAATADINNLLETADLGVLVLNKELYIRQFSTGMLPYIALERSDIGRPLENFAIMLQPESIQSLFECIRVSLKEGRSTSRELRTRKMGYTFCRTRPSFDVHGEQSGVVVTLQDITELKRLAEEVRRFAFLAAHDLVQPLNTIGSSITLLKNGLPDDLADDMLQMIRFLDSSTSRMRNRVESILDFARIQEVSGDPERINMNVLIRDALDDLRRQVDEAGAEVIVGDLPQVMGLPRMMLRAFENILSNALKFRRTDRGCRIDVSSVEAPEGMVVIRIADNGIGIAEEHKARVFEPFARLNAQEEYTGDGMGLAMTAQIVQRAGGKIEIAEGIDGGVAFLVTLKQWDY